MRPEEKIENKFVQLAAERNYWAIKFVDPARKGAPDRMILLYCGTVMFIEFKVPGGTRSQHQIDYSRQLQMRGFIVEVHVDAAKALDSVVKADKRMRKSI